MSLIDELYLRPMAPSDEGFVVVSWCAELARGTKIEGMERDDVFNLYRPHVLRHFSDGRLVRVVACDVRRPEQIVGFLVARPSADILFNLHVKGDFRGQRVATWMLESAGMSRRLTVASDTRDARRIRDEHPRTWTLRIDPTILVTEF